MSDSPPPPDVIDQGHGAALPPRPRRPRRLRRGLAAGGAVVLLGAAGVGAWAAYSFFQTGAQPAEALPDSTLGYLSIDLDPSGGQKIAALRTLNKFPSFKDSVGISSNDDLRKKLFETVQRDSDTCRSLDYDRDVKPWLGNRAAVAAVDLGGKQPQPVVVVQVTDDGKADAGLQKLAACGDSGDDSGDGSADEQSGWHIADGWAVIASSDKVADQVATATGKGSLADDADFKKWTGETGDAGVLTMYAAPAAGDYLADHASQLLSSATPFMGTMQPTSYTQSAQVDPAVPDELVQRLRDFKGLAATVRFGDGSVELSLAGDPGAAGSSFAGTGAGKTVESLPADVGAAFGLGLDKGWFGKLLDQVAGYTGQSGDDLAAQLSQESGLTLPADAETLAGDSIAVAVGPDIDPDALSSGDTSNLPVAVKVHGDPDAIKAVLAKLTGTAGSAGLPASVLASSTAGDSVALGPDADFRDRVADGGNLGDESTFTAVIPQADRASAILYLDLDRYEDALRQVLGSGSDTQVLKNLTPVQAFGMSAWTDDGVAHAEVRLTTD